MGKLFKGVLGGFGRGIKNGPISSVAGIWLLVNELVIANNYQLPKTKAEWATSAGVALAGALLLGAEDPKISKGENHGQ